jgi:hypothetical protein
MVDLSKQHTDSRSPNQIINVQTKTSIPLSWMDSLIFIEFESANLSEGMKFDLENKKL